MKLLLCMLCFCYTELQVESLHLQGKWDSRDFFLFLTRFGFQQTNKQDKKNTLGYIYGNITSKSNILNSVTLVVVDSEYFLEYYGNRTKSPKDLACPAMFKKIESTAWDADCNTTNGINREDFLRKIPCPRNKLCDDEESPRWVIPTSQFTYRIQDEMQPRFWYISFVACYHNSTASHSCVWSHSQKLKDLEIEYDIWLVNGHPFEKHYNPFEHQFTFEMHDVFEIYLSFFVAYCFLLPVQCFALVTQKHMLPFLLTTCMVMEFVGVILNLIHVLKFAFDGQGIDLFKVVGNFIDNVAQCLFMLLLLVIVKGWTISTMRLSWKSRAVLLTIWSAYTAASMGLFVWNLVEVDIISDKDEWQTWPGYIILAFRLVIMVWFLLELKKTFTLEQNKEKNQFYLHFGAGFLVWFVYLPIVAVILTQISALWRYKTILSVTYSADFISYLVMVHLLWPTRSRLYFNLSVETHIPQGGLELSDIAPRSKYSTLAMSDSESDESQEVFDSANFSKETHSSNGYIKLTQPKETSAASNNSILGKKKIKYSLIDTENDDSLD